MFEDETPWFLVEQKRRWAVFLLAFVLMGVVWHFSTREKGLGVSVALLLLYVQIELMWDYRRETWLWVSLTAIAAAHLAALWLIPFHLPEGPAMTWAFPLVVVDGYIVWVALHWLAKRLSRLHSNSAHEADPDLQSRSR